METISSGHNTVISYKTVAQVENSRTMMRPFELSNSSLLATRYAMVHLEDVPPNL